MTNEQKYKLLQLRIKSKVNCTFIPEEMAFFQDRDNKYTDQDPSDKEIFRIVEKKND